MKIRINIRTGKGDKSTTKEIDKTVDLIVLAGQAIDSKLGGVDWAKCKCYRDGTSLSLIKK